MNFTDMTKEDLLDGFYDSGPTAQLSSHRAELLRRLALAERLEKITREILSIKDLYCDHNPGDPCRICALEEALKS